MTRRKQEVWIMHLPDFKSSIFFYLNITRAALTYRGDRPYYGGMYARMDAQGWFVDCIENNELFDSIDTVLVERIKFISFRGTWNNPSDLWEINGEFEINGTPCFSTTDSKGAVTVHFKVTTYDRLLELVMVLNSAIVKRSGGTPLMQCLWEMYDRNVELAIENAALKARCS